MTLNSGFNIPVQNSFEILQEREMDSGDTGEQLQSHITRETFSESSMDTKKFTII
jgi:hypothetical protein